MKTITLLLLSGLCLLLQPAVRAQEISPAFKEEETTLTRQLAALVSLDDARQLPIRRLTQQRLSQEADARRLYVNDPDMLQKKLTGIGQEYTAQLSTVLTPPQYERYLAAPAGALPASLAAIRMPEPVVVAQAPVAAPVARKTVVKTVAKPAAARPVAKVPAPKAPAKATAVRR